MANNQASFFGIPRELRNLIYEHTFNQPVLIKQGVNLASRNASLLSTNKQVRSEGLKLYYRLSTFKVANDNACIAFLRPIPPEHRSWITNIHILSACTNCDSKAREPFNLLTPSLLIRRARMFGQRMCVTESLEDLLEFLDEEHGIQIGEGVIQTRVYTWNGKRNVWVWAEDPSEVEMPRIL